MSHEVIKAYLEAVNANKNVTQSLFGAYISDKSVPLDERWEAFSKAPANLLDYESYGPSFDNIPDDYIGYDMWIHMERRETMSTVDLVDQCRENNKSETDYSGKPIPKVDIDALKEEILEGNIGSFRYDW